MFETEEEERRNTEDHWSKYRQGFREFKVRTLALIWLNGSEQPGLRTDQDNEASRSGPAEVAFATSLFKLGALQLFKLSNIAKASEVTSGLSCSNTDCEVALSRLREEFNRPAKVIQTPPNGVGLRSQYGRKCDRWARNRGKVVSENASCSQLRSRFPSVMIAFRHQSGSNGLKKHWHQAPRGRCDVRFDMRSISRVPLESGKSGIVFEGSAVH
ncbi:hypothetical protein T4A_11369 [Trichinella pseudospiralis]|uniref:Uncharacterized protein n=1 Tax=Trichinella pseudospiralis TaxID=6337 RepID=A0A0V1K649_TRIPS|nr:hypothetical protein T4A_11369 [Trichinella pseudospiralis]KRZ42720.1 hypothetical protein T4C_414 [Trichinella pseudospiralis]